MPSILTTVLPALDSQFAADPSAESVSVTGHGFDRRAVDPELLAERPHHAFDDVASDVLLPPDVRQKVRPFDDTCGVRFEIAEHAELERGEAFPSAIDDELAIVDIDVATRRGSGRLGTRRRALGKKGGHQMGRVSFSFPGRMRTPF